jgi:DNA-binding MarR family transcriptional regulator
LANKSETLQMLIWQIRRLFQQLASLSAEMLEDLGINPSQRAVLEFLSQQESLTVPDIARRYDVSRQHIQQTINELRQKGLVQTLHNPAHKRSVFIQRTQAGCNVFEKAQQRESLMVSQLSQNLKLKDLEA